MPLYDPGFLLSYKITILILGFIFLVRGADYLVEGSVTIARRFGLPLIVIGLTVVAFGTSAPELFVNIVASLSGNGEMAFGNVLGSNISNVLLVLGVTGIILPLTISKKLLIKESIFNIIGTVILATLTILTLKDGMFTINSLHGGLLILVFIIYMVMTFRSRDTGTKLNETQQQEELLEIEASGKSSLGKAVFFVLLGLLGLMLGGDWIVNGGSYLAGRLGVSQGLIGLTTVAIGTSLPELVTSVVSAFKKKGDLAIGNVLGSNIFNLLWVLGASSLINPLKVKDQFFTDLLLGGLIVPFLFLFVIINRKFMIYRYQAFLMLGGYGTYLYLIIAREG